MRVVFPTCAVALCLLTAGCQNSYGRRWIEAAREYSQRPIPERPSVGIESDTAAVEPAPARSDLVKGKHVVIAAEHPAASAIGVDIYRQGGNVVDAAVATAFAVCVANPSSCGIGGGGFMLIHLTQPRRVVAIDYREVAPAGAHRDMFVRDGKVVPELSRVGGLAVGVPGEVAGLTAVQGRYGKLSLARVMAPAIRLARDGAPVGAHLAKTIAANADPIRRSPELARLLLHADGSPLRAGERLRQPELAATLQLIANKGAAAFYRGPIAKRIVDAVQAAGGVLTEDDLERYQPVWREPIELEFRGDSIFAMPPPSSAGVLLEVLGTIEKDALEQMGPTSTAYQHLLVEAMKHAFADRARLYGDPIYGTLPVPQLIAPANLDALRARITPDSVLPSERYGSSSSTSAAALEDHGTSHLSVLDAAGNAVACTTTINTAFGAMLIAGDTGIVLNNEMDDFSAQPGVPNIYGLVGAERNAVAPGRRPLSSMSPTIVSRDGRALLAIGGSGGPLILSGSLQTLLNARVFGLDAAEAVTAPRLHHQWMPPVLMVEPGVSSSSRADLTRRGHSVRESAIGGAVQLVQRRGRSLEGASDARKEGQAAAW